MNKAYLAVAVALCTALTACGDEQPAKSGETVVTKSIKKDLNRARFSEAAIQSAALQQQITLCLNENDFNLDTAETACNSGSRGIAYRIPPEYSTTYFDSIRVKGGAIIMTAGHKDTLNGETYILDPVINGTSVTFELASDSTCIQAGYC